jgi:predicted glutamine amidotransferase
MCRFIAYLGKPLIIDEVLYKPKYSLIKQSIHARETDEPLNGDGFGLGWYAKEISDEPGVFRSIQPAWNDPNLQYLAEKISSNCFFAHVRTASTGDVMIDNCHPFHYKKYLYMHNGDIGNFTKIKRHLRQELSDEIYNWIKGHTDSEHLFALFLERLPKNKFNLHDAANTLANTIREIEEMKRKYAGTETTYISAVFTNGKSMIAVRYISHLNEKPLSLHYALGNHFEFKNNEFHIRRNKNSPICSALIVSESLNGFHAEWEEIPVNHMLLIEEDLSPELIPLT